MGKIIWVASYPRSGNTWVRFLLANLLRTDIDGSAKLLETIPDIHRGISGGHLYGARTSLIKTHWAYGPDFPMREDTIGAIYVLRNPVDAMLSNLNYHLLKTSDDAALRIPEARRSLVEAWIADYVDKGGDPRWIQLGMGSWEQNVASWTAAALPFPRLVVRYEDLTRNALRHADQMSRFLKLDRTPAELESAVERSSFAALRALEEREIAERRDGIFYDARNAQAHRQGLRFVNRGEVGAGEALLTEEQRRAAAERFGPAMRRHGYL